MEETSSVECIQNSIDWLPDELLSSIVSLLPVKEAARTTVLARRWRCFWKWCRFLDFDGSKMLHKLMDRMEFLKDERVNFVEWVDGVLNLHLSETIDTFRVLFDLDGANANDIDRWIEFAFRKKVKKLELNVVRFCLGKQRYAFPDICHHTQRLTCESLVSLRLTKVDVGGEVLEFLISNCPFLEELVVKSAFGFKSLTPSCQAIRLRHLAIIHCLQFRRLEICSPNLVSCAFSMFCEPDDYITVALKDVSSLLDLSLGARTPSNLSNSLPQISGCLSSLETLILQTTPMLDDEELEFPNLPRLKKLVLEIDAPQGGSLLAFTPLINAAPLLSEMVLKMMWDWCLIRRPARCLDKGQKHQCLKVFRATGFSSRGVGAEVALYVLENAASLEQMIINGKVVTGKGLDLQKAKLGRNLYARHN